MPAKPRMNASRNRFSRKERTSSSRCRSFESERSLDLQVRRRETTNAMSAPSSQSLAHRQSNRLGCCAHAVLLQSAEDPRILCSSKHCNWGEKRLSTHLNAPNTTTLCSSFRLHVSTFPVIALLHSGRFHSFEQVTNNSIGASICMGSRCCRGRMR